MTWKKHTQEYLIEYGFLVPCSKLILFDISSNFPIMVSYYIQKRYHTKSQVHIPLQTSQAFNDFFFNIFSIKAAAAYYLHL